MFLSQGVLPMRAEHFTCHRHAERAKDEPQKTTTKPNPTTKWTKIFIFLLADYFRYLLTLSKYTINEAIPFFLAFIFLTVCPVKQLVSTHAEHPFKVLIKE